MDPRRVAEKGVTGKRQSKDNGRQHLDTKVDGEELSLDSREHGTFCVLEQHRTVDKGLRLLVY